MSISFGEATFGIVKRKDELVAIDMPEVLPPSNLEAPRILSNEPRESYFGRIAPMSAAFNPNSNIWETVLNSNTSQTRQVILLSGDTFIASDKGVFQSSDGVSQGRKISNVILEIKKIDKRWDGKQIQDILHIKVSCHDGGNTTEKVIKVPAQDFKDVFELIRKRFPSVYTSIGDGNAKEEYLTRMYQRDIEIAEIEYHSKICGWIEFQGLPPQFYVGEDTYYALMNISIPDIRLLNRREIFIAGSGFRQIGHENGIIEILWLAAHISLSLFWLKKFGVDFRSVIFVKGKTNLFKTTVVSLLANIFAQNRERVDIPLTSTPASTQKHITKMCDQVVLIDDFSNSAGANNNQARNNAETVIRAVGDGRFAGKMNVTNLAESCLDKVQCVIIITGEDDLSLSESSLYRLITLPIVEGTFDGEVLTFYNDNQNLLQNYFALFVQFLTEHGFNVVGECALRFKEYRKIYATKLSVPRYIDAISTIAVEIDLITFFGKYCGMNDLEMTKYREHALTVIENIMSENLTDSKESKPDWRFLYAITQNIGTTKYNGLAPNEAEYVKNPSDYIGFEDQRENTCWLRFDDVYKMVVDFYRRQGESFLTSAVTIKKTLLQKGLSKGKLRPAGQGGNEYVCKSNIEPRKNFLVIYTDKVEKFLEDDKEEK